MHRVRAPFPSAAAAVYPSSRRAFSPLITELLARVSSAYRVNFTVFFHSRACSGAKEAPRNASQKGTGTVRPLWPVSPLTIPISSATEARSPRRMYVCPFVPRAPARMMPRATSRTSTKSKWPLITTCHPGLIHIRTWLFMGEPPRK